MPRLYLTNDSYPELRDVQPQWARSLTWWRAILRAFSDRRFWAFLAAQAACILALAVTLAAIEEVLDLDRRTRPFVLGGAGLAWFCLFAYLQVSWGGDLMRSHLRAVSQTARYACPGCGHSLVGHLEEATKRRGDEATKGKGTSAAPIRCPECAALVPRDLFAPPYRVPRRFRAFPPWRA